MDVTLTPELEQLVQGKVASGHFNSANEVVLEGLRLIQERDAVRRERSEDLRREVQLGIDAANRGELVDGPRFFQRLRRELVR